MRLFFAALWFLFSLLNVSVSVGKGAQKSIQSCNVRLLFWHLFWRCFGAIAVYSHSQLCEGIFRWCVRKLLALNSSKVFPNSLYCYQNLKIRTFLLGFFILPVLYVNSGDDKRPNLKPEVVMGLKHFHDMQASV